MEEEMTHDFKDIGDVEAINVVPKGKWFTMCCEKDLDQAREDEEVEYHMVCRYWDTKEEALKDILKGGGKNVKSSY